MYSKKNKYIYFDTIANEKITIRELENSDYLDIFLLFSNENVTKYLAIDTFKTIDEAKSLIDRAKYHYENKQIFYLGIINNENDKLIGYIGLSRFDLTETTCQVVYALNENYWYRGIMVDALKLFISYLFNIENKQKIIATHIDLNNNSGKVMLKANMKRDSNYDQIMIIKGKPQKLIGYSIEKE